jgi:hypothetical protein
MISVTMTRIAAVDEGGNGRSGLEHRISNNRLSLPPVGRCWGTSIFLDKCDALMAAYDRFVFELCCLGINV